MTVAELISLLELFDPDMPVHIFTDEGKSYMTKDFLWEEDGAVMVG